MQCIVRRGVFALDLARIGHAQARTVGGDDESGIARLPAAEWIENGAVKLDTVFTDARDSCVALAQVSVFAKQRLCRHSDINICYCHSTLRIGRQILGVHSGMPPRSQYT